MLFSRFHNGSYNAGKVFVAHDSTKFYVYAICRKPHCTSTWPVGKYRTSLVLLAAIYSEYFRHWFRRRNVLSYIRNDAQVIRASAAKNKHLRIFSLQFRNHARRINSDNLLRRWHQRWNYACIDRDPPRDSARPYGLATTEAISVSVNRIWHIQAKVFCSYHGFSHFTAVEKTDGWCRGRKLASFNLDLLPPAGQATAVIWRWTRVCKRINIAWKKAHCQRYPLDLSCFEGFYLAFLWCYWKVWGGRSEEIFCEECFYSPETFVDSGEITCTIS